jgi:hypothetical protein
VDDNRCFGQTVLVVEYLTIFFLSFFCYSYNHRTGFMLCWSLCASTYVSVSVVSGVCRFWYWGLGVLGPFFCHIRAMYCTCVCSVVIHYALLMGGFVGSVER